MKGRRVASLERLRRARVSIRNAVGGKLAAAEGVLQAAARRAQNARKTQADLDASAAARFTGRIYAADLVQFEDERQIAAADVRSSDEARIRASSAVTQVQKELAQKEQDVRRVDRVLLLVQKARRALESKTEQRIHDDLVNFKQFLGRTEDNQ